MGWFLNCKDFTEKVSRTLDERTPPAHRILIRIRRWICRDSDTYYRQVHLMHRAAEGYDRYCSQDRSTDCLSEDACRRIKDMLAAGTGENISAEPARGP